jgi:hypothetical protein
LSAAFSPPQKVVPDVKLASTWRPDHAFIQASGLSCFVQDEVVMYRSHHVLLRAGKALEKGVVSFGVQGVCHKLAFVLIAGTLFWFAPH